MAKAKKTPVKAKLTKTQVSEMNKEHSEALYAQNKEAIDKALKNCSGHLKKLDLEVAREVVRRLFAYHVTDRL